MRDRINIPALASLWVPVLCLALATGCTREEAIDGPESGNRSEIHFFTSTQTRAGEVAWRHPLKFVFIPIIEKRGQRHRSWMAAKSTWRMLPPEQR